MKYEALSEGTGEMEEEVSHEEKTHVNLSIGILRAAGLKVQLNSLIENDYSVRMRLASFPGTRYRVLNAWEQEMVMQR